MRHAPHKVPIHLQEAFHKEIRNLEQLGILEPVKDVTEWVNSFVIMEKKVPVDSSNTHSPEHSVSKKLRICLDPRDLNKAWESVSFLCYYKLLDPFLLYQFYLRLSSSTTLMHVICMRPRLLLNFAA